jgi:hypothetical protein
MKEEWGCNKPTENPVWVDDEDEYFTCPFKFYINCPSARDFLKRYDDLKDGIVAPLPYDKTLAKFLEAVSFFNGEYCRFLKDKQPASNTASLEAFMNKDKPSDQEKD